MTSKNLLGLKEPAGLPLLSLHLRYLWQGITRRQSVLSGILHSPSFR